MRIYEFSHEFRDFVKTIEVLFGEFVGKFARLSVNRMTPFLCLGPTALRGNKF